MHTVTSPPRKRGFDALAGLKSLALGCGLLLFASLEAASPPAVSLAYTTPNNAPIQAGITVGSSGTLFFATLGVGTDQPKLIGLSSSHTQLWTPVDLGAGAKVLGVPSLSPHGDRIYLGTDAGNLQCRYTSSGAPVFTYTVPGSGDRKVRCTPALNFNPSHVGQDGAV